MMVLHIILRKLTAVFLAQQGKIIGGKVLLMVDIPDVLLIHKDAPHSRYIECPFSESVCKGKTDDV